MHPARFFFLLLALVLVLPAQAQDYQFERVKGDLILGQEMTGRRFIMHTSPQSKGETFNLTSDNRTGDWQWDKGLVLLRNGNVGIGVLTPDHRLTVDGTIKAREMRVLAADWPDFVFAPDYDLMPLDELAQYIETHGHLPGIPTAGTVAAEGVAVGAMQAQLLQKVEELTLYLIQVQRNLDALALENAQLKARFAEQAAAPHGQN